MGRPPGSTGFKGVRKDFRPSTGKNTYRAFIRHGKNQVQRSVGTFSTPEAAARQYDRVAIALHGSKATLNFSAATYTDDEIEAAHTALEQQSLKTSEYKGVMARRGRWQARAYWQYKCIALGTYDSETYAAEQHDLAQIQLYGGAASAVPAHRLNFDWSKHSPDAIKQLLHRVAALVMAGMLQEPVNQQQGAGVSLTAPQGQPSAPAVQSSATTAPAVDQALQQPNQHERVGVSISADASTGAPVPAKRPRLAEQQQQQLKAQGTITASQRAGRVSVAEVSPPAGIVAGEQINTALFKSQAPAVATGVDSLREMQQQQHKAAAIQQTLAPTTHQASTATAASHSNCQQQQYADGQLVSLLHDSSKSKTTAVAAAAGHRDQRSAPTAVTSAPSPQRSLQQLLPDDIHSAAVLLWCAEEAYMSAKAAGSSRAQLKGYRRDVHAATEQLAAAVAAAALAMVPAQQCDSLECVAQHSVQQESQKLQQQQQGQRHTLFSNICQPRQHLPSVVLAAVGTKGKIPCATVTDSGTIGSHQPVLTKRRGLQQLMMAVAAGRTAHIRV